MSDLSQPPEVSAVIDATRQAVGRVISGKPRQIDAAIATMLAEGHLLLEDVPGVGKTMLAKALAKAVDCTVHRIQFTPDLLPGDITGMSVFNQETRDFEFKPGGIFANIVIGDEINRASPKTQSALLEAMAERTVSADGVTHQLPTPFMVIATQNPIEMEGTYPLPEAQRDRFMTRITMDYPPRVAELAMLDSHGHNDPLADLRAVTNGEAINRLIQVTREVYVAASMKEYLVDVVASTRSSSDLRLGASPRASLQLLRICRARALMQGRNYVIPDDVSAFAVPVLGHRVLLNSRAQQAGRSVADVINAVVAAVPVPDHR